MLVTFGEIMLRLATPGFQRLRQATRLEVTFGGGEANVAASVANYGLPVEYVTRLHANDLGRACMAFLRSYGVGTRHIATGGNRIGIYFLETGAAQRGSQVIYDRAGSALAEIQTGMIDWPTVFEGAQWFHWTGITPAISEGAAAVCLEAVQAARAAGLTVSCDLNYRAKLWNIWGGPAQAQAVLRRIVENVDVLVGNEEDLQMGLGIAGPAVAGASKLDPGHFIEMIEQVVNLYPQVKVVATTLREVHSTNRHSWSAVAWINGRVYQSPTAELDVYDRVGGGDGFAAGLFYGLLAGRPEQEAVNLGWAHDALITTFPGDTTMATLEQVEAFARGGSARIQR